MAIVLLFFFFQRDLGPALGRHPVSRAWRDAEAPDGAYVRTT